MEGIILLSAVFASLLVFLLRPVYALIIYIMVFAWFPPYLTVKLGTLDFPACRIVILAVYANLLLQTRLTKSFKFILPDKLLIIYFLAQIVAGGINSNFSSEFLENRAGVIFDTLLPYFAFRMTITTKDQYFLLLKGILLVAFPLALIGFYQCLTGHNPFGFLRLYSSGEFGVFSGSEYAPSRRGNYFRADVTFSMCIMFGLFFAMLGPMCLGLIRNIRKHKTVYIIGMCLMAVGVFSSMSAGPFLAAALAVMFIGFYRFRGYWKLAVITIILCCGLIEVISNRHFYEPFGRYTFSAATAAYRSRLIDVALFEGGMSGHWLTGYGFGDTDPGPIWAAKMGGHPLDIVNHYILILFRFGLVGLVPFLIAVAGIIKKLIEAFRLSLHNSDKWLIWCLGGALFGVLVSLMSTSLFGQSITVFYMLFALCGNMPGLLRHGERYEVGYSARTVALTKKGFNNAFLGAT